MMATVAAAMIGGGAFLLAAETPKKEGDKPATTQAAKPVNKFCPVMGKSHEVDPKVTTKYKGKVIGFCCDSCITDFEKDPEKYMKNLE